MREFFLIILTFGCTFCAPLTSKIIEAYNLTEIAEHLKNLNTESLLLWDVDSTLIMPADQVLAPGNDDFLNSLENHYFSGKTYEEVHWLSSNITHRMSFCLVDENVVQLISSLQQQSIPMLGFTAMRTGPYGAVDSMEEWRVDQLRNLGIDFSAVMPQHHDLEWEETVPYYGYPIFKEGILCTDSLPKGIVLTTFFQKIDWCPNQVLFIDDDFGYLQSVDTAMEALGIPFLGVHYRAVENIISPLDEELAHHQFHVLIHEEIWLKDQEAKALLQNPKQLANPVNAESSP